MVLGIQPTVDFVFKMPLYDRASDLEFGDQLQLHLVELPKYHLEEESVSRASELEQWVFFLDRAEGFDAESLERLLPGHKGGFPRILP